MLQEWNVEGLQRFSGSVTTDVPTPTLVPYGDAFVDSDRVDIPSFDLPEGIPGWMFDNDGWARRVGETPPEKRANITITVPKGVIPA